MFKQRLRRLRELNTTDNADIAVAMTYFVEKVATAALYSQHQRVLEISKPYWNLIMPMLPPQSQLGNINSIFFYLLTCQNFVYGLIEFSGQCAIILYFFEDLKLGAALVSSAKQVKLFRLQKTGA